MGLFANPLSHAGYPPGVTGTPTTQPSEVRAATAAEVAAGTLNNCYVSPATAQSAIALDFASPPVLGFGSTTPRPVHATTLSTAGLTTLNGNLLFNTAGNKTQYTSLGSTTAAGANSAGTVTLVGGTATVATTSVTASSLIRLNRQSVNSSTGLGILSTGTITAGTSFVINAATTGTPGTPLAGDTSIVFWEIVN